MRCAPLMILAALAGFAGMACEAATEPKAAWEHADSLPVNLTELFDNDAISEVTDRADGNFDCPDHADDIPGSTYPAENLPATGSTFSFNGIYFLFPSHDAGAMNNLACAGQRIELPPGRYKALYIVGASENGNNKEPLALSYREGPAEAELALTDWCQEPKFGERVAFEADCRYTYSQQRAKVVREEIHTRLFLQTIRLDATKTLESLTLPYSRRMHVFAMTLEAAAWGDEQRDQANATADAYASLGRRQPAAGDEIARKFETLAKELDALAATPCPFARQFGWLRTQVGYYQRHLTGRSGGSGDLSWTGLRRRVGAAYNAGRDYTTFTSDLRALQAGKDPFPARRGCFLRSYRSEVDGSLQSYSLAVPRDYKGDKPFPLIVCLHGHAWYAPFQGHPVHVDDGVIQVAPQGRGSQDYMLAAEGDVLTVIDDVVRDYKIDPDRIILEGHSMGGTGSWTVGVHHPDRFAALAPVCGNADRHAWDAWSIPRKNLRPVPPRFQALRNQLLDATDPITYAGNLLNLGAFAGHGAEDDVVPVENSRNMAAALQKLGCPVDYKEFPGVRHWGFPMSFYDKRWDWMLAQRRTAAPERVRYRTASLRDDSAYWVRIDRFLEPLAIAEIDAKHVGEGRFEIATKNIAAFSLDLARSPFARGSSDPSDRSDRSDLLIDGERVRARGASPTFVRSRRGHWYAEELPKGLAKRKGLEGPVADAYLGSFLLVRGTASTDEWEREAIRREVEVKAHDWQRLFLCRPRVKDDTAVTDDDIRQHHLILYGGPGANAVTARLAGKLPIRIEADRIRIGRQTFQGASVGVKLCYPNPLNPERYAVVFAGLSPDALHQINNRFGNWFGWGPYDNYDWFDYGIFDARTLSPETFLCVGFFDEKWELDDRYQFPGDPAVRETVPPQKVPQEHVLPKTPPAELCLSDLMPTRIDQHKGTVGFDRTFEGNKLSLSGKSHERGLGVRAPSLIEYPLDGKYATFRATVGIDLEGETEVGKARARGEWVQFVLHGDGRRLYSSEWLQWNSKPVAVDVPIKGVKVLSLEVDCSSSRWLVGSADWAEARVVAK